MTPKQHNELVLARMVFDDFLSGGDEKVLDELKELPFEASIVAAFEALDLDEETP